MVIKLNGTSIEGLDQIQERKERDNTLGLSLIFHECKDSVNDFKQLFSSITTLFVERTDLEGNVATIDYSTYDQLSNVERVITDESDITTIRLASSKI